MCNTDKNSKISYAWVNHESNFLSPDSEIFVANIMRNEALVSTCGLLKSKYLKDITVCFVGNY